MSETTGQDEIRTALDALVRLGSYRPAPTALAYSRTEDQAEAETQGQLKRLLTRAVPAQLLFRRLAEVRHPQLKLFLPRLREVLGSAPLEAETLAALCRGLAHPDELLCANALILLRCAPAQLPQVEAEIVALVKNVEAFIRSEAADALRAFPALRPTSVEALTWLVHRHPRDQDGCAAREALSHHGFPAPIPPDGVDVRTRVRWLWPLPALLKDVHLLGKDGALYFAFTRDSGPDGMARLRLTPEGPCMDLVTNEDAKRAVARDGSTLHHAVNVWVSKGGADPWVLTAWEQRQLEASQAPPWAEPESSKAPTQWELYGMHPAFFKHHPSLCEEEVGALSCLSAHQLAEASGRRVLVLFLEAQLSASLRREHSVLVLSAE